MIDYAENKMLKPGNFKEYTIDKQRMLDIINEKKELFEGKIKKDILKKLWKKFQ
jgi:hypothetical protein